MGRGVRGGVASTGLAALSQISAPKNKNFDVEVFRGPFLTQKFLKIFWGFFEPKKWRFWPKLFGTGKNSSGSKKGDAAPFFRKSWDRF